MGVLVNGEWRTDEVFPKDTGGAFVRKATTFRNWITPDGAAGPSGEAGFVPSPGAIISMSPTPARGRIAR